MRQTSIDMFTKIKRSGILSDMRLRVFEILCRHNHEQFTNYKGLTAMEMRFYAENVFHYTNSEHLPKRLSELERHGVIEVVCTRECRRTGHTAIAWGVTGNMPIPIEAMSSRKEKHKEVALEKLRILWAMVDDKEEIFDSSWREVSASIEAI